MRTRTALRVERLEPRALLSAEVVISELLAGNASGLTDEDGQASDWLELFNTGDTAADLAGWHLTDDADDPGKWTLPDVRLDPGGLLVVFASGKDRAPIDGPLHTNFKLRRQGEYVGLTRPDGTVAFAFAPAYPPQRTDVSFGLPQTSDPGGPPSIDTNALAFFAAPTPGQPNGRGRIGFVSDVRFSTRRGYYREPIEIRLSTATPAAAIYYTTDGSLPDAENGLRYTEPIRVDTTTVLRAVATKAEWIDAPVRTQTYIFVDDVPGQTGDGFPKGWRSGASSGVRVDANYAMDPRIVASPEYRDTIAEDLRSLPAISLVFQRPDLWNAQTGIYANPQQSGADWERPVSVEWITPEGAGRFQVDAGARILGGVSRTPSNKKHSFRLFFRGEYGAPQIEYPFFGPHAAQTFDTLALRVGSGDTWSNCCGGTTTYLADRFTATTQNLLGGAGPHTRPVHLYLNGLYWGIYTVTERPDAAFAASYFGGDADEYDALNHDGLVAGDRRAWDELFARLRTDPIDYGAVEQMLDIPSFIDYVILNQFLGNQDWPNNNWYATRRRDGGRWRFHSWDAEAIFDAFRDGANRIKGLTGSGNTGEIYRRLLSVDAFRTEFADRVQRHLFDGGALTPAANIARLDALAAEIDRAIVAESARWGDGSDDAISPPYTRDGSWLPRLRQLKHSYFPQRTPLVLEQYREAGLYPDVPAPELNQPEGPVPDGFQFTLKGTGDIYYTLDGSDPRLPDGGVSERAHRFDAFHLERLVSEATPVRVHIPTSGDLGDSWISPEFDDTQWRAGRGALGYERGTGYEGLIGIDLEEAMFDRSASAYYRARFSIGDPQAIDGLRLRIKYDDGFVAYINGVEVARRNAPTSPNWQSVATGAHRDSLAVLFDEIDLSGHVDLLRHGANVLAIQGLNTAKTRGDFLLAPELQAYRIEGGVPVGGMTVVKARVLEHGVWSPLREATFLLDSAPALRISEIMYNPRRPSPGERDAGFDDNDEFEYLELLNTGDTAVSLAGMRLVEADTQQGSQGVRFTFPAIELAPREAVIVARNRDAFAMRYSTGVRVAGEYRGKLSNRGERITLVDAAGRVVHAVRYTDQWHPRSDGDGASLELASLDGLFAAHGDHRDQWLASGPIDGTPGYRIWTERPATGDLDLSGSLDKGDAASFALAVTAPRAYAARFHLFGAIAGDTDFDGDLDFDDIRGLIDLLARPAPVR